MRDLAREIESKARQLPPKARARQAYVDRFAGLRVEVLAREHPPPHFRVSGGGETANYRISDCSQINGNLRRHYRQIRDWHRAHKLMLINKWNQHRPTDCPVGEYREAEPPPK